MSLLDDLGTKGATAPYAEGLARYVVRYRARMPGEADWTEYQIGDEYTGGIVCSSSDIAKQRVVGFISKRHRAEVDILDCWVAGREATLQTGSKVETVSAAEKQSRDEETRAKVTPKELADRKNDLAAQGFWMPPDSEVH